MPLLLYRFVSYYRIGWSHFTLELCYLSNVLLILQILYVGRRPNRPDRLKSHPTNPTHSFQKQQCLPRV